MLGRKAAVELVGDSLFPGWQREKDRLDRIDRWYRWQQEDIKIPRNATPELRRLAEASKVPWLGLVVSTVAQALYVDGYRSSYDRGPDSPELSSPWRTWHANGFEQRQTAVHRGALAYGYAFATALPGEDATGPRAVLRGLSPRRLFAVYEDPAGDDWPRFALIVDKAPDGEYLTRLLDEDTVHYIKVGEFGSKPEYISDERHDAGVCPVVRYANQLDLDGRCDGEVEPFIPMAARINKTSFDRMLTQHFSSWKIRTVAGMAQPDDEEAAIRKKLRLRQDDMLVAEDPDTKFGTLDETPLGGFIDAWRSDIEALAAVSQTPTHALTGQLINLSAEALAASRAGLTQKVSERQRMFGKSHVQLLRLAAHLEGATEDANDTFARVTWQDMEIRSLSQAVDALGKAAEMLGMPVEFLWERVPGFEKADVDAMREMRAQADPITRMTTELERQARPRPEEP